MQYSSISLKKTQTPKKHTPQSSTTVFCLQGEKTTQAVQIQYSWEGRVHTDVVALDED